MIVWDEETKAHLIEMMRGGHLTRVGEVVQDAYDHGDEHTHLPECVAAALTLYKEVILEDVRKKLEGVERAARELTCDYYTRNVRGMDGVEEAVKAVTSGG